MQSRIFFLAGALALTLPACTTIGQTSEVTAEFSQAATSARIAAILAEQQAAWNSGDIDGFMQAYWRSPDLRFASGGSVTRGWQETRDRYHARYSNRALMGTLSFDALDVDVLSEEAAIVHGAWALQRDNDRPSGLFTLVFKRMDGQWKIVSDTTTSAD
nr:nuclear transport factor 2 family protein [Hyphomonas sp. Mor2]